MKTKRLSIRITDEEQMMLRRRAKKAGVRLSTFIITICRDGQIVERRPLSTEEQEYYAALTLHAQMWQSAANLFHNNQNRAFAEKLLEMVQIMKADRKRLIER